MSALSDPVRAALAPGGQLARLSPTWRQRDGQLDMALAIADTLERRGQLVIEAGTGIGKTFAYLVPALLSGRRVLISTATQALQDQLFVRDIPAVTSGLGLPARVAVLKGRSSYVCLHRLQQERPGGRGGSFQDPAQAAVMEQITRWAEGSEVGDLAELPGLDERSPIRPSISSTRENCLGGACPRLTDCHVNRAREKARKAEVVVVNHHLFFADQVVRESGVAELLPEAEVVIFDEAHQLNEIGVEFLAVSVGSGKLRDLAHGMANQGPKWAQGLRPWAYLALCLEQAVREVAGLSAMGGADRSPRRRWQGAGPEGVSPERWLAACRSVTTALAAAVEALDATAGAATELAKLLERSLRLARDWACFQGTKKADAHAVPGVRWLEWGVGRPTSPSAGTSWQVLESPPDCAEWFQPLIAASHGVGRSWIFTSATLGGDETLSWFTERLGLATVDGVRTLRLPSPFDHAQQAGLYVPTDLPEPADAGHTPALAQAVARWATRLGGRTLVLTTTLRAAARLAQALQSWATPGAGAPLNVLAQGAMGKRELLARFRAAAAAGGKPAVLVASMSFWEGVDLAGDVLQLLVIDKLPFPPPDDPLIEARARALEAHGGSAFNACYLPEAALALKQGVGRLIRSETDRGALVIADRRLVTRSYGNRLLAALPPMRRLLDETELECELDALVATRSSTTDRPGT